MSDQVYIGVKVNDPGNGLPFGNGMAELQGSAKYPVQQAPSSLDYPPCQAVMTSLALRSAHSADRISGREEVVAILVLVLCFGFWC